MRRGLTGVQETFIVRIVVVESCVEGEDVTCEGHRRDIRGIGRRVWDDRACMSSELKQPKTARAAKMAAWPAKDT